MSYYYLPSAFALTKAQAIKMATKRWELDTDEMRQGMDGIVYQASHGLEVYIDWIEFPDTNELK